VPGNTTTLPDTCRSIGAFASDPANWKFDAFTWDIPSPSRVTVVNALNRASATVYFDRIIRHKTLVSDGTTDPFTFRVFLNGISGQMPRTGEISLGPDGVSTQAFCKTIDLTGADSLQILFTVNNGAAAWSQFPAAANYGAGGSRSMTTGQSLLLPVQAPGQKPTPFMNREFELQYHIEYQPPVSVVAGGTVVASSAGAASGGPGATTGGATTGGVATGGVATGGVATGGVTTGGASGGRGTTVAGGRAVVAGGILGHTAGIKDVTVVTPCTKI
jgi:hypothetical protein